MVGGALWLRNQRSERTRCVISRAEVQVVNQGGQSGQGGLMLLKGGGWSADSPIPEGSAGHLGEGEGAP